MNTSPNRRPRRRALPVLGGVALGVVALIVLAVGGFAATLTGRGGYMDLGHAEFRGDGHAVVSDPYDWGRGTFVGAHYGTVRVHLTVHGGKPAFLGLAPASAVRDYLHGVAYSTGHGRSNYQVAYTKHAGGAPATAPTGADVWSAHASGTGTLTVTFPADRYDGGLVLVAMNADGSPVVNGRVATEATVPSLGGIVAGVVAVGVVLLLGSVALIVLPFRRRRA